MRYEDFTAAPAGTLGRIAAFAGLPGPPPDGPPLTAGVLDTDEAGRWWAELRATHTASGNPMRFTTGRVPVRRDDQVAGCHAGQQAAHGYGPDASAADALRLPGCCGMSGVW